MTGGKSINQLVVRIQNRRSDASDRGANLMEYGLLLMLVFLVSIVSVRLFGESVVAIFDSGGDSFQAGGSGAAN